jgi:hypothetical protein
VNRLPPRFFILHSAFVLCFSVATALPNQYTSTTAASSPSPLGGKRAGVRGSSIKQHPHRHGKVLTAKDTKYAKSKGMTLGGRAPFAYFAWFAVKKSVNQNENRRILRRLYHVFKRLVCRVWVFDFGIHLRHRFKEW